MNYILLSLAILLVTGLSPLLFCKFPKVARWSSPFGAIVAAIFGLCGGFFAESVDKSMSWVWLYVFPLELAIDSLSRFFLLPIYLICPLAAMYGARYFGGKSWSLRVAVNASFSALLQVAMVLVVVAGNLLTFALAWEVMSLASFVLVLYEYEQEETRKAAYLFLLFTQGGALLIFAAFAVISTQSGSFAFDQAAGLSTAMKTLAFLLAFLGFASKAGAIPLHLWLPHAHPAAPSHVSAVLSGVMLKIGIYGVLRTSFLLGIDNALFGYIILGGGIVSGLLGVFYALGKHNFKRFLAYSSIENIGIILIGIGLGMIGAAHGDSLMSGFGFAGALLHVLNHALFKSLLFFGAGAVARQAGTVHIDWLGGLLKRMPWTGSSVCVGSASISGLPPFNGFVSEFLIYLSAFHGLAATSSAAFPAIAAIVALAAIGGLALCSFTKVVGIVFLGQPRSVGAAEAKECGAAMTVPMALLALSCLVIGLVPQPFISLALAALTDVMAPTKTVLAATTKAGNNLAYGVQLFVLAFIVVLAVRGLLYRGKMVTRGPTWGCAFTRPSTRMQYTGASYGRSVINFFRPAAVIRESSIRLTALFPEPRHFAGRVDDLAEFGIYRTISRPLLNVLARFHWIQHGNVQLYIGYIVVAILILAVVLLV